jgi:hypothetical protein
MALEIAPGVVLTPTPTKTATPTNYISDSQYNLMTQYIPELEEQIVNRFGSQMITGMLEKLGKESPFQADLIKWNEEGRLTQLAESVTRASNVFTSSAHTFRVGELISVRDANGAVLRKGQITAVTTNTFTALCGHASGWSGTTGLQVYAFSNEFQKGTTGLAVGLNSQVQQFTQKPIIIKEYLEESGSNLALRTWVNTGEGYCWYFKNSTDTKKRFNNAIENGLILSDDWAGDLATAGVLGTQGLFPAIEEGNIFSGQVVDLDDYDEIFDRANAQECTADFYAYNTSSQNGVIDRMLKAENVTGVSWGEFSNEADMLKMGFEGFKYRNFQVKKSNWKFLDNATTEGSATGATKTHGIMIPMGSKKVYDVMTGTTATNPILHVKYRASSLTDRKYKMAIRQWDDGTLDKDARITEFITERALCLSARNQCFIAKG